MSKTENRYCRNCQRATNHRLHKETEGHQRAMEGLFTFGVSEFFNGDRKECLSCGYRTKA